MNDLIWLVEAGFLSQYLDKISTIEKMDVSSITLPDISSTQKEYVVSDGVAIIEVKGVLSEDGPSFIDRLFGVVGTSYKSIRNAIAKANIDNQIKRIALLINSPGGRVNGVDETYLVIRDSQKPVIAYTTGICASGAYYLAVAAKEIISLSPSCWVGSIGAVITAIDKTEYFKKIGINVIEVTSKHASNKRLSPLTDEGRADLARLATNIESVFHQRIIEGRKTTKENIINNFGQGAIFMSSVPNGSDERDALSRGMIDKVKNGFVDNFSIESNDGKVAADEIGDEFTRKEKNMNLEQLLKENPQAAAELKAMIQDERAAAVKETQGTAKKALDLAKGYGESVMGLAVRVATGESSYDALEATVTTLDAQRAASATETAAQEQEATGTVHTEKREKVVDGDDGEKGLVSSDEDINAAAAELY